MQPFDYAFYKNINFIGFLPLRNRKSVVIPGEFNAVPKVPVVGLSKNETKNSCEKRSQNDSTRGDGDDRRKIIYKTNFSHFSCLLSKNQRKEKGRQ